MKIRTGFVSNSSSSSFIIKKGLLTERLIARVRQVRELFEEWKVSDNLFDANERDNDFLFVVQRGQDSFFYDFFTDYAGIPYEAIELNMGEE